MPIYEYYCPDNHTIYQFYAKTLAQGKTVPKCPQNPSFRMTKILSSFAVTTGGKGAEEKPAASDAGAGEGGPDDARMEAAMGAMEKEFANVDENDPKAMARMMRRMSEITGEKIDGEMEEVVRKLEEGADPESLEDELGGEAPCSMPDPDDPYGDPMAGTKPSGDVKEAKHRFRVRRAAPARDPQLYDYE